MKFSQLINMKMPTLVMMNMKMPTLVMKTLVGIFIFISIENFTLRYMEPISNLLFFFCFFFCFFFFFVVVVVCLFFVFAGKTSYSAELRIKKVL